MNELLKAMDLQIDKIKSGMDESIKESSKMEKNIFKKCLNYDVILLPSFKT